MAKENIGAALVVGGGIAAIQAALDLAGSGFKVYMAEKSSAIGGAMAQLDKTFPTNDCSMCIMSPKLVEVGRHPDIEILTLTDVLSVQGEKGDFTVRLRKRPRYVDMEKCIACGLCAQKCPKKVPDAYNQGLAKRKAAHVLYPQAVPLKYAIDPDHCLYLNKGKCRMCEKVCPAGAVNFDDREEEINLNVGAILLAPGFSPYDPSKMDNLAYGASPNVLTSLQFERILSASGPTRGHLIRPGDNKEPSRIAWLQCVGSRDINRCENGYCSSVCCMYAIKQAIIAKEHADHPLDCDIFFMDMRTHGKGFEDCYNQARERHGVAFHRSRVHTVLPLPDGDLSLRYVSEDGKLNDETYDLVILSVGLTVSPATRELAGTLGIDLSPGGFVRADDFVPCSTSRDGVFACGAFAGPKDIPQSVIEAGSAADLMAAALSSGRHTLTQTPPVPMERDLRGERPRLGIFVCHCGININGVVDVPAVAQYARSLPYVEYVSDNLYSCSQDTQNAIAEKIREHRLNRIVVAACSPKTHEPLFQETLAAAELNKYLLEFVNIRNQDSWVHQNDPEKATEKARDLVRMAAAKAVRLDPLAEETLSIHQDALVIGGGISGLTAALSFSAQGYRSHIVERDGRLGGQANHLHATAGGASVPERLAEMTAAVASDPNITVHLDAEIEDVEGFVGNFETTLRAGGEVKRISHGVAVIATGAQEHRPSEYLYGEDGRVITGLELDERLNRNDLSLTAADAAVFIQCVGSREPDRPYCSRICCTHTLMSALELLERNPRMKIFVLYRDMRSYGEREYLYKKAREKGVIFIRYDVNDKPVVTAGEDSLFVGVFDPVLGRRLNLEADLLCLAAAVAPHRDEKTAQFFKVPVSEDGFYMEAHVKLDPSAFAVDGVFLCGLAHYPKPIDESAAQARAAVSGAVKLLSRERLRTSGVTAAVNPAMCSQCGACVSICPYNAPYRVTEGRDVGRAAVNPVLCKGCGLCVSSCRSGAIQLGGFADAQILSMLETVFEPAGKKAV